MDVTQEILKNTETYGASDYTAPWSLSSSKSLNYAKGASIQKPVLEKVTVLPRRLNYKDTTGLFGAENVFIKVDLKILDTGNLCFEEPFWQCLKITYADSDLWETYYTAEFDPHKDLETVETYEPARIINKLAKLNQGYVGIKLNNLKTGNIYIDNWFDVRLYTRERQEHPYDLMYVPLNGYFYIGFHARNTRRLPYNVECLIGVDYKSKNDIDPRYIEKRTF